MKNRHLSESKQNEQQSEKHAGREIREADGFGDAALHPLLQMQQTIGNRVVGQLIQRKEARGQKNQTGLPDNLKTGLENMSGMSMDDVQVRYNSPKPANIQAWAYTKGTDIHIAPGQERHLPHEAWHVVQQKRGRVQPTMQVDGISINDDPALEHEADVMGVKAMQVVPSDTATDAAAPTVQRKEESRQVSDVPGASIGGTRKGVVQREGPAPMAPRIRNWNEYVVGNIKGAKRNFRAVTGPVNDANENKLDAIYTGVYNSGSGLWIAAPSGPQRDAHDDLIQGVAPRGGHATVEGHLLQTEKGLNPRDNVGFSLQLDSLKEKRLTMYWTSGVINKRAKILRHGDSPNVAPEAPEERVKRLFKYERKVRGYVTEKIIKKVQATLLDGWTVLDGGLGRASADFKPPM